MKLAIMQPYFFPYIGYFQLVKAVDKFIFYDDVQFIQRGWINRNYIISKDGKQLFTIPLKKSALNTDINKMELSRNVSWKEAFLKTICSTYGKAPFFEIGYNIISKVIDVKSDFIVDFCIASIEIITDYLGLNKLFKRSSFIIYDHNATKEKKLIDILRLETASEFILPPGSIELYNRTQFEVPTYFLKPHENLSYVQFSKTRFEKNLSIIDIIMLCSKNKCFDLINSYTLE